MTIKTGLSDNSESDQIGGERIYDCRVQVYDCRMQIVFVVAFFRLTVTGCERGVYVEINQREKNQGSSLFFYVR